MAEYLFEIGTEEMPAQYIEHIRQQLQHHWTTLLAQYSIDCQETMVYASPRRLAIHSSRLAESQQSKTVEKLGPWYQQAYNDDGTPTAAALGFAKSCNSNVEALAVITIDGKKRLAYSQQQPAQATDMLIPQLLEQLFTKLHLPRKMHWGSHRVQFIRPIQWLCSVYNNQHLPLTLLGIASDDVSYGHRFLAPEAVAVTAGNYLDTLAANFVVADQITRKAQIVEQVEALASAHAVQAVYAKSLLEQLVLMVEYPQAIYCAFDKRYLALPIEVLTATMVEHQKCICLYDGKDMHAGCITIANIDDAAGYVCRGNQKVLEARLRDAEFFYRQDNQQGIDTMVAGLANIANGELGTMEEKSQRLATVATSIVRACHPSVTEHVATAARLCKADLCSLMVGEFASLQGIMGSYYAHSYPQAVGDAIREHYAPQGADDAIPQSDSGRILAIADKLDAIAGMFLINKKPTGEKDPYGLRRAAIGIIRIGEKIPQLPSLRQLCQEAVASYQNTQSSNTAVEMKQFILDRLQVRAKEQGIAATAVAAVSGSAFDNIHDFYQRLTSIQQTDQAQIEALAELIKRMVRITADIEPGHIDPALFEQEAERELYAMMIKLEPTLSQALTARDYQQYLHTLLDFQQPVTSFFDTVLVNTEVEKVRANRIALLAQITSMCTAVADLSQL